VFSTCEHWIRTVPTLEPDPDDPDDVDTEGEDHAFDATKAGLMRRTGTPQEKVEETADDGAATVLADGTHVLPHAARPRRE